MRLVLQVDIPGPLGESAVEILESLPNLSVLNGVVASKILEPISSGKLVPNTKHYPPTCIFKSNLENAITLLIKL